jgi:hypothetical protein
VNGNYLNGEWLWLFFAGFCLLVFKKYLRGDGDKNQQ